MKISVSSREDPVTVVLNFMRERKVVVYRELLDYASQKTISAQKLKRVLKTLIKAGKIVELKCRVFVESEFFNSVDDSVLSRLVTEALKRNGVKKCGKPLYVPRSDVVTTVLFFGDEVLATVTRRHSTSSR